VHPDSWHRDDVMVIDQIIRPLFSVEGPELTGR